MRRGPFQHSSYSKKDGCVCLGPVTSSWMQIHPPICSAQGLVLLDDVCSDLADWGDAGGTWQPEASQ